MDVFNTTIIVSSVYFLILVDNGQFNNIITAENSSYGLSYEEQGGIEEKQLIIQAIQNNSLIGKFKKTNYIINDDCIISLYNKNNMTNEIIPLTVSPLGFFSSAIQCKFAKAVFTEIRQKKLISKFKKLNKKVNDIKREVDYIANNRAWW